MSGGFFFCPYTPLYLSGVIVNPKRIPSPPPVELSVSHSHYTPKRGVSPPHWLLHPLPQGFPLMVSLFPFSLLLALHPGRPCPSHSLFLGHSPPFKLPSRYPSLGHVPIFSPKFFSRNTCFSRSVLAASEGGSRGSPALRLKKPRARTF